MLIGLQKAFEKAQLIAVWNRGIYFKFTVLMLTHAVR